MMNWLYYILEANVYLTVFYCFYRLFLFRETFYTLNRVYLITSSMLAFMLPMIQVGLFSNPQLLQRSSTEIYIEGEIPFFTLEKGFVMVYGIIALFFVFRFLIGFRHIIKMLTQHAGTQINGIRIVEKVHSKMAFSFFNLVFIDPELPQTQTILKHEMAHINQKHSYDILLFELIRISSWFNPIVYFLKRDIKLIHEYLADEETTREGVEKYDYAVFLIQNSCDQSFEMTNQIFNSSILKQRISMLNQKKSAKWAKLRLLLILPLTGGMICSSAMAIHKSYGLVDLYPQKKSDFSMVYQDTIKRKSLKKLAPPPPPVEPSTLKRPSPPVVKRNEVLILEPEVKPKQKKIAPPPPPVEPSTSKKLPPPPPVVRTVKFPPPVVKKDQVKFPPPVVKPNQKKIVPPPPIEPKPVKSDQKVKVDQVIYGDPTPSANAEKKEKIIYGDPIPVKKSDHN